MILTGLARLGRDCEVRFLADGTPVANLSLAWNYGKKQDGKQPTQWVSASLWGERATKLQEYLTKGTALCVVLDDVHVEEYEKRDGGTGTALRARVVQIEFAGSKNTQSADGGASATSAERQQQPASEKPARAPAGGFDEMDDDIPFAPIGRFISGHAI